MRSCGRRGFMCLPFAPGSMRTGSHLNALFSGDAPREYRWFSLLANLPGVSASAQHAARKIVRRGGFCDQRKSRSPPGRGRFALSQVLPEPDCMLAVRNQSPAAESEAKAVSHRRGGEVRELELAPASKDWLASRPALQPDQLGHVHHEAENRCHPGDRDRPAPR